MEPLKMYPVGENLNVMSKVLGPAMKARDPKPIQEMAIAEEKAGVGFIDLNIGPSRKDGPAIMEFVVQAVQEVTDLPLWLDTMNIDAMEAGLKVYKPKKAKCVINSIMARPDRMDALIPMAVKYDAGACALLWGPDGIPRDTTERGALAADIQYRFMEAGIPTEDTWLDPIVSPVSVEINQVTSCIEFMAMLQDIWPGVQTTCGLSNISNGSPEHLRPVLNQTYLMMLRRYGMNGPIVDAFDEGLAAICRNEKLDIEDLVHKLMDGENMDPATLNEEQLKFYKTVRVLMGLSLYSHSWLEV
jgi:5-methyltetrahydrofolate corrinoid/iron sulfur protein methyltransferase